MSRKCYGNTDKAATISAWHQAACEMFRKVTLSQVVKSDLVQQADKEGRIYLAVGTTEAKVG